MTGKAEALAVLARRREQGVRLQMAIHAQSERASELALEAFFARQRGELERAALLVEAALASHLADAPELEEEPYPESAAELIRRVRAWLEPPPPRPTVGVRFSYP